MKHTTALAALALATAAGEPVLVPDVSQREVEIRTSFRGTELLLFGAILYPGGRIPGEQPDIAVVLKGPSQSIVVREKRKLAGLIWANADSTRFRSAPGFYAIASSRPIAEIVKPRTAAIYELGLRNIHLSPASNLLPGDRRRFQEGFVDLRQRAGLYAMDRGAVDLSQGVLYRARLVIPARVPVGRYVAETFLIRDGKVVAAAERTVDVRKAGFERYVANAARRFPLAYGLAAVALSVLLGWAAGAIFSRR